VYVIRLYNGRAKELRTEWQSHWMTVSLYDNTTEHSGPELCQDTNKVKHACLFKQSVCKVRTTSGATRPLV
jgi:hypothetical protein